ncbi:acetyl esterase/lipase [Mycobacterium sp. MAA66]|uniref:alpha/beta hydrolase n=1 Tax=Mycobacterium sp. MAA66 TaxID=3156297 RepID=UPI003513BD05
MSTQAHSSAIHPDLVKAARFIPRTVVGPRSLKWIRRVEALQSLRGPGDAEALTLSSGVGIRLHRPPAGIARGGALLWIHGGGYVIGSPAQDDAQCRRFAENLGITVAAVKYRLAPENPYPAGLEDCYTALKWLTTLPTVDPALITIGGASAGGGLAAALAQLTRDRGEIALQAQLLVYPMLDDRSATRAAPDQPGQRLWDKKSNRYGWSSYLGGANPEIAAPGRSTDLSGLSPAWVGVGTLDLFHDEDVAYSERLRDAGVRCELEVVPGAFHGFDAIAPKTPVAQSFFNSQAAFLRSVLVPAGA